MCLYSHQLRCKGWLWALKRTQLCNGTSSHTHNDNNCGVWHDTLPHGVTYLMLDVRVFFFLFFFFFCSVWASCMQCKCSTTKLTALAQAIFFYCYLVWFFWFVCYFPQTWYSILRQKKKILKVLCHLRALLWLFVLFLKVRFSVIFRFSGFRVCL